MRSRAPPDYRLCPRLDPPATPEKVLTTIERLKAARRGRGGRPMTALAPILRQLLPRRSRWCWCRSRPPRARPRARPAPRCWSPPGRRTARSAAGGSSGRRSAARATCWRAVRRRARSELPLGPAVGQCCGGNVTLELRRAGAAEIDALAAAEAQLAERLPLVLLFGAGHVGRALARALAPLPLRLRWIDGRAHEFPDPPLAGPGGRPDRATARRDRGGAGRRRRISS